VNGIGRHEFLENYGNSEIKTVMPLVGRLLMVVIILIRPVTVVTLVPSPVDSATVGGLVVMPPVKLLVYRPVPVSHRPLVALTRGRVRLLIATVVVIVVAVVVRLPVIFIRILALVGILVAVLLVRVMALIGRLVVLIGVVALMGLLEHRPGLEVSD